MPQKIPASQPNVSLDRPSSEPLPTSSLPKTMQRLALTFCALLLILLSLSLMACAAPAPAPCEPLPPVLMPAMQQPLPPVSYSISVQQSIKRWAQRLTGMSATSKP